MKGVFAVYTGRDIAKVLNPFPSIVRSAPLYRAVTIDKVRYVGEPVAVVLASDRYAAEDGLAAIEVDYEPLEAVTRPHLACEAGAPILHDELKSNVVWRQHYRYGDPDAAFAKADHVVRVSLTFPKYNSTPLETYGVVAEYLPERAGFVVHGNFQGPFSLMPVMARALGVPENKLRIVVPQDVGGSFGNKAMIYPYIALMAACARLAGRPVKWIEDRMEHLLASASGTDRESELEAAVSSDGRIHAIRMIIRENVGAYLRAPEPSCIMRSLTTFSGPYRILHGEIDASCVLTNKLPTGLNRGYGGQQYIFSLERLVDRVAHDLNLDRLEVRRRNFLKRDEFPYKTMTGSFYDSGDYDGCLDKALAVVKQEDWLGEMEQLRKAGRLVGLGYATAVHSAASNIGYVTLALSPDDRQRANYQSEVRQQRLRTHRARPVRPYTCADRNGGRGARPCDHSGAGCGARTGRADRGCRRDRQHRHRRDAVDDHQRHLRQPFLRRSHGGGPASGSETQWESACDRCASARYRAGHARVRRRRHQEKRVQPVDVAAPACRRGAMEIAATSPMASTSSYM